MAKLMMGTSEVLKVMMGTTEVTSLFMGSEEISQTPDYCDDFGPDYNQEACECIQGGGTWDAVNETCEGGEPTIDYSTMPFTIEALENGDFTINREGVDYSLDGGDTWNTTTGVTTLNLSEGDTVQFKRNSQTTANGMFSGNTGITFNVYGNIMSLFYGDNFVGEVTLPNVSGVLGGCFKSSSVISAGNLLLPATTISQSSYNGMFNGCSVLTSAPSILPATTLAKSCYSGMFQGCTSLTTAPELPATSLMQSCYNMMFFTCSSLNYVKCLATSNLDVTNGLNNWLGGVAATGTFVKDANTTWPSGQNGIPNDWAVVNA